MNNEKERRVLAGYLTGRFNSEQTIEFLEILGLSTDLSTRLVAGIQTVIQTIHPTREAGGGQIHPTREAA